MNLRSQLLDEDRPAPRWQAYLGITGLLLVLIFVLAGGIIWYNSSKASSLAITAADQLIREVEDKVDERIKLLYDPMFAIVAIASLVPEFTTPAIMDDAPARALLLRALRIYPQILSIYVGFDNGDFLMVTHIAGPEEANLRQSLQAPDDAVFAVEMIGGDAAGARNARWIFLGEDGSQVGIREPAPTTFDPRERPWYRPAQQSEIVEHSDLYVFASNGEPGFTLSRSFSGPSPGSPAGVMGADLAANGLADFLRQQRITPSSTAFIFTKAGEIIAMPDQAALAKPAPANGETMLPLPKVADLRDPVISGLVAAYEDKKMVGSRVYNVAGRTYIGRVAEIPSRYGRDQLLAIMVPIDEIEQPIIDIRNQTLLYSIAFLVFALPLYVTLTVAWIDRRLRGGAR
jgi:adenylate cyclase